MRRAGCIDHRDRDVHTASVEAAIGQVGRHPARSASRIEDRPGLPGPHRLGEGIEHGSIQRRLELCRHRSTHSGDVLGGRVVIDSPGRREMIRFAHRASIAHTPHRGRLRSNPRRCSRRLSICIRNAAGSTVPPGTETSSTRSISSATTWVQRPRVNRLGDADAPTSSYAPTSVRRGRTPAGRARRVRRARCVVHVTFGYSVDHE